MERLLLPTEHPLRRLQRNAFPVGVVALAFSLLGAVFDPTQFLRSYLVAFVFWVGTALGCMALLMIHYVTGGRWGAMIRRQLEAGVRTLPLMALAFLPIAFGTGWIYEWAQPEHVAHDPLLQHKALYLNVPFFLARAIFYFVAWILMARFLTRWSVEQDDTTDAAPGEKLHLLSRGGLLLLGLTMTFASIDWMMSLEPHWFSTIYGVIFMVGGALSAFAFVIPVTASLATRGPLEGVLERDDFHDLGKLTFAFVMLWAYVNFSQFLIIWSANLPEEIPWYLKRFQGGWQVVALGLVAVHFVLPFVLLLARDVKRNARRVATVAMVLFAVRYVDVFWMLVPAFHPEGIHWSWLDVTTVVGLGGVWIAMFVRNLDGRALIPVHDPAFEEAA
jgi:hypothetical protein